MATRVTELRKGMVLILEGDLWVITKYDHITPGNWRAINQLYLRNLKTGNQKQVRMGSGETVEVAFLDRRGCEYLYKDNDGYVFMDSETYEQITLSFDLVSEMMPFVKENEQVTLTFHDGLPISLDLPPSVVLAVVEAEAAVKGNSVTNLTKNAKMETGLEVKVPLHIDVGEKIKISTETSEFLGRAN